jgi:hypothetical protein
MGADKEVLDLLSPKPPVKGNKRWDEEFHQLDQRKTEIWFAIAGLLVGFTSSPAS